MRYRVLRFWSSRSGRFAAETGRIDAALLEGHTFPPDVRPKIVVCGATVFAEALASALVDRGHDPAVIRIERYGTSAGL